MISKNPNIRLVKLPSDLDMVLYLIKEELKATKIFNGLTSIGFDDSFYRPYFGPVVLTFMGFDQRDDQLLKFYDELIDNVSDDIEADNDSIIEGAFDVYVEITIEKKRRSGELKQRK